MVNYSGRLDRIFSALADPTRRAILARLALAETSVTELASPFDMSLPAVSKHLAVLEGAGLLARRREGRVHRCRLEAAPIRQAADWMIRYRTFWEERLDALESYLIETEEKKEERWLHHKRPPRRGRSSGSHAPSRFRGRKSSGPGRTRKP